MPASTDCVFCGIVSGNVPASFVFQNKHCVGFADLRQPNGAHFLVVPTRHVETIYDLDEELGAQLMADVVRMSNAVRAAFAIDGLSIWQSNGKGAYQEVPHVHFHVFGRKIGDPFLKIYPGDPGEANIAEQRELATRVRSHLKPSITRKDV
jgi:histidine triad (HIT) family protein